MAKTYKVWLCVAMLVFAGIACGIAWYVNVCYAPSSKYVVGRTNACFAIEVIECDENMCFGLPSTNVDVLVREGYVLGYSKEWKQAQWAMYRLTDEMLKTNVCRRSNAFAKDPDIDEDYSTPDDYQRSGFDRGHLVPAADMLWSSNAMAESFFMSNISPQRPKFNQGIWKRLEEWVRDTAMHEESIFVVIGPIVSSNDLQCCIGTNKVVVPSKFFKAVFDYSTPMKMVGFIMDNEGSNESLSNFVVAVDSIEAMTGLDLFSALPDDIEDELEKQTEIWHVNKRNRKHKSNDN